MRARPDVACVNCWSRDEGTIGKKIRIAGDGENKAAVDYMDTTGEPCVRPE